MSVTFYVVVPFDRDPEGNLVPGEPKEAPNGDLAKRRAEALVPTHAGAVAFSRTGDPATGDFEEAKVVAVFGAVDVEALGG